MHYVTMEEYGWPGHYCCADRCRFKRNTLLIQYGGEPRIEDWISEAIIVSTVGEFWPSGQAEEMIEVGGERFYETMIFKASFSEELRHYVIDTDKEIKVDVSLPWAISERHKPVEANKMHNDIVMHLYGLLSQGHKFQ